MNFVTRLICAAALALCATAHAADGSFTLPAQTFGEFTPPYGTTLPPACTPPKTFIKTDATAAAQIYQCTATNTWTQQVGTGGGGGVTNPLVLTSPNGAITTTLEAVNAFQSYLRCTYSCIIEYGLGGAIGISGINTQTSTPLEAAANGNNLWRRGMWLGRHSGQITSAPGATFSTVGIGIGGHLLDEAPSNMYFLGQHAWAEATVNTVGGNVILAPGLGSRKITIADYTTLSGKTITTIVNGVTTTKTEGAGWTAATSNAATATSLAAALTAINGIDTTVSGNVVYVHAVPSSYQIGPVYSLVLSSNNAGAVVTQSADGKVQLGNTAVPATTPSAFSATHYYPMQDGTGTVYYVPASNTPW